MTSVTFCAYDEPNSVGGPLSWLERLLPALRESGFDCRCLFLTHHGETGPCLERMVANGFECEQVACHPLSADRVRWVLEKIHQRPPDVFVPNLVVAAYFAARWIRAAGIPTVGVLHSDDPFYQAIQEEFVFGARHYQVSAIACVSDELRQQVERRNPRDVWVRQIPYGVPLPDSSVQRETGKLRVAYVGRLAEEQKRISEVTRALCRVSSKADGIEARMYGDGPARSEVERILASEGVNSNVCLMGRVEPSEMYRVMQQCDVLVLLSDYEGLPIALLEAMACGVVPVCLNMRSGIPELVQDGVTGLVVENRKSAFDQAILRLHADPALWQRLSRAARERVTSAYGHAVSVDRWAKLLHQLDRSSLARKPVSTPRTIRLPEQNPALAAADPRAIETPLAHRLYQRSRMFAGRLKRSLASLLGS